MPVVYNNFNISPAPFVNITTTWVRDENDDNIFPDVLITLNGTIAPGASGVMTGPNVADAIIEQQERLYEAFSVNGKLLEITSPNGSPSIEAYCTVDSLNFQAGQWVTRCDYSIGLRTKALEGTEIHPSGVNISSKSETWQFSEQADSTVQINHSVQAVGLIVYTAPDVYVDPLQEAKDYCSSRMISISNGDITTPSDASIDLGVLSSVNFASSGNFWNYSLVEGIGDTDNSWQVTETFVYNPSGSYLEEFIASITNDIANDNLVQASIQGTIIGFADNSMDNVQRLAEAQAYLPTALGLIFTRLNDFVPVDYTLNPTPNTTNIVYDRTGGLIQYSYAYTAKRGTLIPNSLQESIDISDAGSVDVFAQFVIPGRSTGPLIQGLETITAPQRTITINALLSPSGAVVDTSSLLAQYLSKPDTDDIVTALNPSSGNYYLQTNTEDWNPITRRYSRVVTWVMDQHPDNIDGSPNLIHEI